VFWGAQACQPVVVRSLPTKSLALQKGSVAEHSKSFSARLPKRERLAACVPESKCAPTQESASQRRIEMLSYRQMTKANTRSRRIKTRSTLKNLEQRIPYPKPALRSEAFAKALADAKSYAKNPETLDTLFNEAARKAAAAPRDTFKENWPYLQTMLRFIRAYSGGIYSPTGVSDDALLWVIAALNYFVDPFDLVPDEIPFLGFVDDATVIEFAVTRTRLALDDFMTWETEPSSHR
jgi:uncharacterized membrane protein YkvA (DUF1232 family)